MTTEHSWTPEPWPILGADWPLELIPVDYCRARACVNALAGLNPEAVKDVVKAAHGILRRQGDAKSSVALDRALHKLEKQPATPIGLKGESQ